MDLSRSGVPTRAPNRHRHPLPLAAACLGLLFATPAQGIDVGERAPACGLRAIGGGEQRELQQFREKLWLVDFWASWCGSCAMSFRFLNQLDRDLRESGLQVLGVNVDEQPADAHGFLGRYPAGFELAADPAGDCARAFGVGAMPASYLIDREGVVREVQVGFRAGEARRLRARIEALLAVAAAPR